MFTAIRGHPRSILCVTLLFLCSCSEPARYVIVSEDVGPIQLEAPDQRLICLASGEAKPHAAMIGLRTKNDVETYLHRRPATPDPVEHVLYHMIREDYAKAAELLRQSEDRIPLYLRLLLSADLASEDSTHPLATRQLLGRYQDAFEVQPCTISRSILQLRIRQVRYRQ